jgi:diguanylate cyclase (GGDEF)-like protein
MARQDIPRSRIAMASMSVVVLIACAAGVTIWRYEHAISQGNKALETRSENVQAQRAGTEFWREREAMNEYLLRPLPQILREVSVIARRFERATGRLLLNNDAKDRALVDQWREANRTFLRTFDRVRRIAETGTSHEARPTRDLNAAEEQVLGPLQSLQAIYETEIATRRAEQSAADTQALVAALIGALLALGATVGLAYYGMALLARMRRQREQDRRLEAAQAEFADAVQVTEGQDEMYDLLKRRLERSIAGARAVVLNRNNSEDRLEAATRLPADTELPQRLQSAKPRSCLAVRFGRKHEEGTEREPLLGCALCSGTAAHTTCEPLLVGGEVIGSALVMHSQALTETERVTLTGSVAQAGPVLANLRNLAIAEFRAATDALTGLPNSRAVHDTIKRMVAQASRSVSPLAALMLDLDHFKQINDAYGHGRGDDVLAAVAATIDGTVRESDFVGRYGGEEFIVLLPDTGRQEATTAAEKMRSAVTAISVPGVPRAITISIGVALMPDDAGDSVSLLQHADRRLYAAKGAGRNLVVATDAGQGTEADGAVDRSLSPSSTESQRVSEIARGSHAQPG